MSLIKGCGAAFGKCSTFFTGMEQVSPERKAPQSCVTTVKHSQDHIMLLCNTVIYTWLTIGDETLDHLLNMFSLLVGVSMSKWTCERTSLLTPGY